MGGVGKEVEGEWGSEIGHPPGSNILLMSIVGDLQF